MTNSNIADWVSSGSLAIKIVTTLNTKMMAGSVPIKVCTIILNSIALLVNGVESVSKAIQTPDPSVIVVPFTASLIIPAPPNKIRAMLRMVNEINAVFKRDPISVFTQPIPKLIVAKQSMIKIRCDHTFGKLNICQSN